MLLISHRQTQVLIYSYTCSPVLILLQPGLLEANGLCSLGECFTEKITSYSSLTQVNQENLFHEAGLGLF